MNDIQVKCYLFPNGVGISANNLKQASEIRRFAISYNSEGLFVQLTNKIKSAYGNLIHSNDVIKTYWQDEENDLVCFSTDHEALYAIDLHAAISYSSRSAAPPLFKVYVSIQKPFEKSEAKAEEPQMHFGIVCDGCDGAIRGTRYTCKVCPDYDLCSTCKEKGVHKDHEFIVFTKPVRQRCPYGRSSFRGMHRQRCSGQTQQNEQPQPSTSSAQHHNPFAGLFPFISSAIPMVNDPEQLKNFGEHLKQFLDPFGIDVDYYLDTKDKKPTEKETKQTEKQEQNVKQSEKQESEKLPEKEAQNASYVNIDTLLDISNSKSPEPEFVIRSASNNTLLFDINPSAPIKTSESIVSAASSLKEAIDSQSFVHYPKLTKEEKSEETDDSGFNVVDIEKELKYIKCIDLLKSMGYNDEGGWITRLVITKEGNINQVLDAMQPSK